MKSTLILLSLLPFVAFSQNLNNSISVLGGAEYHDSKTHAWDIELNYNRQFIPNPKWSAEFGMNFSILEYKGDSGRLLDYEPYVQQYGPYGGDNYMLKQNAHYSKTSALRLQAGINYMVINKTNWNLSLGLNFVNEIRLYDYEHGQRVLIPFQIYDTLEVLDYHYTEKQYPFRTGENAITIQAQPHVDFSARLTNKLWFTSRVAYYARISSRIKHSRAQLLVGLLYKW